MEFDKLPCKRKSETCAFILFGIDGLNLLERSENLFHILQLDADARVSDGNFDKIPVKFVVLSF